MTEDLVPLDEYRRRSRRSVLLGGLGALAGAMGWRWVQTQPTDGAIPSVLRGGLEFNEAVWSAAYDPGRRVPEFGPGDARPLRVNGLVGMHSPVDLDSWSLRVEGPGGALLGELGLDDVVGLGTIDQIVEHKCIEGWVNITHWTGVPFAALADAFGRTAANTPYVGLESVGGGYYVGLDMAAAMHPQVLLGTGLDGAPLSDEHGAPLRLVSPIHYGTKSIKRIGTIRFSDVRPRDYWAERGYDWYSQH